MLVILMLLIKFINISLCCKLYVRNESLDLQYIMINNNCGRNAIWICVDDGMNMRYLQDELLIT
jgi:hypothetical protein